MANGMGSLYIGASGLQNSQRALNVTSNNLANVDTTGYVRQQVLFADAQYTSFGTNAAISKQQAGLGVTIGDVVHARDVFLDKAYRTQAGMSAFYSTTSSVLNEIQDYFQEMDGEAFEDILTGENGLYVAFQELAKDPSDSVNQNLVLQKASLFISRAQALYKGCQDYQQNLNTQVSDDIDAINKLGNTIKELNNEIQRIESGGMETAMDLRDQRDAVLDQLSGFGKITYKEIHDGIVKVSFEGTAFVDESNCYEMGKKTDDATGFITPYWPYLSNPDKGEYKEVFDLTKEISSANQNDIGELKALVLARGDGYADYNDIEGVSQFQYNTGIGQSVMLNTEAELDQLVHRLVTKLNDVFCPNKALNNSVTGTDKDGNAVTIPGGTKILDTENCSVGSDGKLPPQELFTRRGCDRYTEITGDDGKTYYVYNEEDPNDSSKQYTVNSIEVNEKLKKKESLMPSHKQNGEVNYQLGKDLERVWENKTETINPMDTMPCNFAEYYNKMVGELATLGDVYGSTASSLEGSVISADNSRQQVIGVSSDEELTNMIKYQNAYNASSRFINVISEMIEHLVTQLGNG